MALKFYLVGRARSPPSLETDRARDEQRQTVAKRQYIAQRETQHDRKPIRQCGTDKSKRDAEEDTPLMANRHSSRRQYLFRSRSDCLSLEVSGNPLASWNTFAPVWVRWVLRSICVCAEEFDSLCGCRDDGPPRPAVERLSTEDVLGGHPVLLIILELPSKVDSRRCHQG